VAYTILTLYSSFHINNVCTTNLLYLGLQKAHRFKYNLKINVYYFPLSRLPLWFNSPATVRGAAPQRGYDAGASDQDSPSPSALRHGGAAARVIGAHGRAGRKRRVSHTADQVNKECLFFYWVLY
jgi:hypothetical protein